MTHDRIIGAVIIALGLVTGFITLGWSIGFDSESRVLTPYFFPRMVSIAIVLCGIWIVFFPKNINCNMSWSVTKRLIVLSIWLFMGAFIAHWDFLVATVLLGILILRMSEASIPISVTYAVIVGGGVFVIFRYMFDLQIPSIML